jgi:hypothetical protein
MKMDVLFIMLLAAILLYTLWWNYKNSQEVIFRSKFFELRSKMRDFAISGDLDVDSKLFIFLDKYFTSIINDMSSINLYKSFIMGYILRNKSKDLDMNIFTNELNNQPILKDIFNDFIGLLTQYSIRKHFITLVALKLISLPFVKSIQFIKELRNKMNVKLNLNYWKYEEMLAVIG